MHLKIGINKPELFFITPGSPIFSNDLSAADIGVASYLYYAKILVPVNYSQYPAIDSYLNSMEARPAFKNTLSKR